MAFNSLGFVVFFLAVYLLYLVLDTRSQNLLLLVASYAFYAAWDYRFLSLILLSTAVDYAVGLKLPTTRRAGKRRALLAVSLVVNLGLLGTFKYFGFFADSMVLLLRTFGWPVSPRIPELILPVGISFYTFQTLAYTLDVYRERIEPTRSFPDFALYVAFFPQLVAGPIERASRLLPQIQSPRRITTASLTEGAWLILLGYYHKLVLADNLAPLVDEVFQRPAEMSAAMRTLGVYGFALQIYGDFAGYSLIARGLARLLGMELVQNFRRPFFASQPADFWQRWHVSLSTWLRDYLFLPVAYARERRARARGARGREAQAEAYRWAVLVTMLLGGLWHGASWRFVAWGAYHAMLLLLYRQCRPWLRRLHRTGWTRRWWHPVAVLGFFQLSCFGWLLFRIESGAGLIGFLRLPPTFCSGAEGPFLKMFLLAVPLLVLHFLEERSGEPWPVFRAPRWIRIVVYLFTLAMISAFAVHDHVPFYYFQF